MKPSLPTTQTTDTTPAATRIGLLAGWGSYPLEVAQALRLQGRQTYCLGVKGHADPALAAVCDDFEWFGLAKLGRAVRYYKRHGVRQATMAGKIQRGNLASMAIKQPRMG